MSEAHHLDHPRLRLAVCTMAVLHIVCAAALSHDLPSALLGVLFLTLVSPGVPLESKVQRVMLALGALTLLATSVMAVGIAWLGRGAA